MHNPAAARHSSHVSYCRQSHTGILSSIALLCTVYTMLPCDTLQRSTPGCFWEQRLVGFHWLNVYNGAWQICRLTSVLKPSKPSWKSKPETRHKPQLVRSVGEAPVRTHLDEGSRVQKAGVRPVFRMRQLPDTSRLRRLWPFRVFSMDEFGRFGSACSRRKFNCVFRVAKTPCATGQSL